MNTKNEQLNLFKLVKFDTHPNEKPINIKLSRNQIWCPYCSNIVVLKKDNRSGVKKCPICNISERDFWVKKINTKKK